MRYFATISYQGTQYSGWQIQPNAPSVQKCIEQKLSILLRKPCPVVGCGRTDAGVHAKNYVLHFDADQNLDKTFLFRLNKMLPEDIVFHAIRHVQNKAHARFDARYRAYRYFLIADKDPFRENLAYHYPFFRRLDKEKMQAAAKLLLEYDSFAPFCKSKSDAKTMNCKLFTSEWNFDTPNQMVYHIAANRFLRGMVRLIVGMCLRVGQGKLSLSEVQKALDCQQLLPKSLSAPPQGLFLTEVRYEDEERNEKQPTHTEGNPS